MNEYNVPGRRSKFGTFLPELMETTHAEMGELFYSFSDPD